MANLLLGHGATQEQVVWIRHAPQTKSSGLTVILAEAWLTFRALGHGVVSVLLPAIQAFRTDIAKMLALGESMLPKPKTAMSLSTPRHGRAMLGCAVPLMVTAQIYAQQELSWQQLAKGEHVKEKGGIRWLPRFVERIKKLDGPELTLPAFMLPLEQSIEHDHLIPSANPVAGCPLCLPADSP